MRDSSARRPFAALAGVLVALLSAVACGGEPQAAPPPSPTPIARLNTTSMQVPRIDFCRLVPGSAVSDAVSGKPVTSTTYGNGDEQALPAVGTDVVHEIGCVWTGKDGSVARAWVFARPVDPAFAATLVAAQRTAPGCRAVDGPAYGTPSVAQLCLRAPGAAAGTQRMRHAGLFGQTWLSCELQSPATNGLGTRADAWCVQVLNALNTAR